MESVEFPRARRLTRDLLALLGLLAVLCLPLIVVAQEFPARSIRLIVPFPAGGSTDILGRHFAAFMSEELKQPVVVDNRAGAQGRIGAQMAARSAPDGYTLLIATSSLYVINPLLYKKLAYDPAHDFQILSVIGESPLVLSVRPTLAVHNLSELVALARKENGNLNFASAGNGTTIHMAAEMFKDVAGLRMTHIPFIGSAPALNSVLAGQTDLIFADVPNAISHIRSGALRPLSVAYRTRLRILPEVPTMAEAGFGDFEAHTWFGIAAPARLPERTVARVKVAVDHALESREFRTSLAGMGFMLNQPSALNEIEAQLDGERRRWARVVASQRISMD